jgi:hypothetical protein
MYVALPTGYSPAQRPVRQVMAAVPAGYRAPVAEAMLEILLTVGAEWQHAGQSPVYV